MFKLDKKFIILYLLLILTVAVLLYDLQSNVAAYNTCLNSTARLSTPVNISGLLK